MNKFTTTLAGLAIVATASIAPAMAQGTFTFAGPGTFNFSESATLGLVSASIPVTFNPTAAGAASSSGLLVLTGGTLLFGTPPAATFGGVTETFTPTSGPLGAFTDTGLTVFVSQRSATTFDLASDTTTGTSGNSFNLVPGVLVPVPEASTVVSFGALLALGGLAVLRRKSAKNAA